MGRVRAVFLAVKILIKASIGLKKRSRFLGVFIPDYLSLDVPIQSFFFTIHRRAFWVVRRFTENWWLPRYTTPLVLDALVSGS